MGTLQGQNAILGSDLQQGEFNDMEYAIWGTMGPSTWKFLIQAKVGPLCC